ncbi:MAG TPA: mechanosensitive ion channel domain-containing protein [Rhizomicrobium sp.]|nr:mechanosensitive ion channel domain-containing protein [Rhizomicrobium sp.]
MPVRGLLFVTNRFAARLRSGFRVIAFLSAAMVYMAGQDAFAQTSAQIPAQRPAQTSAQPPAKNAAPAQTTVVAAPVDAARVVQFLNQTIAWYHQFGAQQRLVSDANDDVYFSADRQMANEVVRLAFQYARTQAEGAQPTAAPAQQASGQVGAPSTYQTLMRQEAEAQKDENQVVVEVDDLQKKIATASRKQKQALQAQLAETQAEVDLAKARADAIRNMTRFLSGASTGAAGLSAQVDALESTLPPDLHQATKSGSANGSSSGGTSVPSSQQQAAPATPPAVIANVAAGSGLWERATSLFSTWGKLRSINTAMQQTQELALSAQDIRNPLLADLRELTQRGDELAHQADTANTATLEQERQQLDAVTQQFKQLTNSTIPLAQAGILLGLYQKNLASWHASVVSEFWTLSQGFAARFIFLSVIIALVLGASELWRRAIYKYVRDTRRRWQLNWVRKFVVWGAIATIVTFSLVSQIGSMATFAGLITAGVAVSLQNVIQSIVGYFFLIGKYGIRTGDRVMIGGVSGKVIDVGLVRIHLMEMGGAGADTPTGRVVAFSNSIVFQATPGIFKQIPGTSFAWHEIALTLPVGMNFSTARERLMTAVEAGLADFKDEIAKQHSAIEDAFEGSPGTGLHPTVQLQFTSSGLEALVRYPVALRRAMEIDERVTRAILTDFDVAHAGSPALRLKTATTE